MKQRAVLVSCWNTPKVIYFAFNASSNYCSGGELFEYIYKQKFLQEDEARRLFSQLISSIHYMHQKNIVHRDLKLASFFFF